MTLHVGKLGSGADVVLLHGWGMNAGVWAPLAEGLANRFRLHLVDLPGHGKSDLDPDCRSLADWALAVRQSVPDGAAWIGWSLGAQVAIKAALDDPGMVGSLCLLAGTPRFVDGPDWPHAMSESTFRQFAANLARDHGATLERFLALQVRGAEHAGETLRWLRQEVRECPAPTDTALDNGLELLLKTDLRLRLCDLACPTLWVLGERDTLVPVEMGDDLGGLQPEADVVVVSGAAHAPFLSHPARVVPILQRFLSEVPTHA